MVFRNDHDAAIARLKVVEDELHTTRRKLDNGWLYFGDRGVFDLTDAATLTLLIVLAMAFVTRHLSS